MDVPDDRLQRLADIVSPARIVPATVEFVDIAGLVKGASEGEGLGNQFLANIRTCDAICEVVRYFSDADVVHVDGRVDPASDADTIQTELVLADLSSLERFSFLIFIISTSGKFLFPTRSSISHNSYAVDRKSVV